MKSPLIHINDFKGGMTLNDKMGRPDQFFNGQQLDFRTKPGKLTVGYGWENMGEGANAYVPTEFQDILYAQRGSTPYFAGEDTKIYKQIDTGTIDVARDSGQAGAIRSLKEYESYMYYVQDTTIGRSDLAGTPTYTDNWQTGLNSSDYHPLHIAPDNKLYIGHKNDIASWDDTTFTNTALDLPAGWDIRTLDDFGYLYLAIGADFVGSSPQTTEKTKIFLWNRVDASWNDEIVIPEKGIKAMKFYAGYLWIWAGKNCNLYVVAEGSRKPVKMWSFDKENTTDVFEVYPNAVVVRKGIIYFALSSVGSESESVNQVGIYSFPAEPSRFNLNINYRRDNDDRFKSLGIIPGNSSDIIYASFYDSNATNKNLLKREALASNEAPYGVGGIYESFIFDAPPNRQMVSEAFILNIEPMPANTNLSLEYKKDNETTWYSLISTWQTDDEYEKVVKKILKCDNIQFRLTLNGSGGANTYNRPVVKSLTMTGHLIDKI